MLLAVITGVSIVLRFERSQFWKSVQFWRENNWTMLFRIVPVCVPSVRKWGAYNMRTIVDKFDFKFANRVNLLGSILCDCNFKGMKIVLQGRSGEERKRTEEMLGRCIFYILLDFCQPLIKWLNVIFFCNGFDGVLFTGWPSLTGWWWSTWASAWRRTTSPTWSTWWQTTLMTSMSMRRRWGKQKSLLGSISPLRWAMTQRFPWRRNSPTASRVESQMSELVAINISDRYMKTISRVKEGTPTTFWYWWVSKA